MDTATPTTTELLRAHSIDQRRRGLQESTIGVRANIVRRFGDWMGQRGILAATTEDIEAFLDARKTQPQSRAHYLSHLKVFFAWTHLAGHIETDPTVHILRPRVRPGLPRPIADHDLQMALEFSTGQVRVMLALAAFEGMRCIEIARLARPDVLDDSPSPVIVARGKGDKPRPIPLHPEVWKALQFLPMPRHGPVLCAPDGRPYHPWEVSHIGNDFLHGIGIDATMHRLRHWFATNVYRSSGRDLLLTSDLLGHSNVETTRVYAAWDRAGAPEAVNALSVGTPLGREESAAT